LRVATVGEVRRRHRANLRQMTTGRVTRLRFLQ
jgi:hypothetical protein